MARVFLRLRMQQPRGYVNVDQLQAETSLSDAAAKCGVTIETSGAGQEVRIDCPFGCPGDHLGRKEISVNTANPEKVFCCHAYQCGLRGNMLALMHGWMTSTKPTGGKLRGPEFQRIRDVLSGRVQLAGQVPSIPRPNESSTSTSTPKPEERNVALLDSDNQAIRELATIDEKFIVDVGAMNPVAAAYIRQHPCLTSESMRKWRVGYVPHDGGGDKRGWSLRGHIVYPMMAEDGKVLSWIGRDPLFEQKQREFDAIRPELRGANEKTPPMKHKVPKGFHRGQELFGQQASRLKEPGYREAIARNGIIVVEGYNDVIGLDILGIPAVAICSNRITTAQVEKVTKWSQLLADGKVTLLFDCEETGDVGAKEALWLLAQRGLTVHLGWSREMHDGRFNGRQPESLSLPEWNELIRSNES